MKLSILTLALVVLAGLPQMAKAMNKTETVAQPVITAVSFHSDNCGSCKILAPKVKKAMQAINQTKLDIVKFDFSTKETIANTKTLAESKNLNKVLQQYGAKTGFIVLLNAEGQEVDKLKVGDTTADIAAKLAKAIASAP